jgi:hypothetical protein
MAAIGLTTRPDILLSITAAQEDKMAVNSLIEDAMQVAGANKAANIGTAIHSFAEQLDLGHKVQNTKKAQLAKTTILKNFLLQDQL